MTLDQIRVLIRSKTTQDRMRAVEMLNDGESGHVPLLLDVLHDRSHYVAARPASSLSRFGSRTRKASCRTSWLTVWRLWSHSRIRGRWSCCSPIYTTATNTSPPTPPS